MMIRLGLAFVITVFSSNAFSQKVNIKKAIKAAEQQQEIMLKEIPLSSTYNGERRFPRTFEENTLKLVPSKDWTSGFFAGNLWLIYEFTKDEKWKKAAIEYTHPLEKEKVNQTTHDMGFKVYCSFGNANTLSPDPHYREVIIQSASTLIRRFNERAGVIKSWETRDKWAYPVIIDNMMNLELLFAATRLSGDSTYYRIAKRHAETTMKNHFRPDFSSYHVLDYDTLSGNILQKTTHQGKADESAWARGQAWGLYGYTMCYRETKDIRFLRQAEKIASFILNHPNLPSDLIPLWDFNADQAESRDASAGAIIASALLELSNYSSNKKQYRKAARSMLESLSTKYVAPPGTHKGFILIHSTGHKPAGSEIDVPMIYGDYYYLEGLMRLRDLKN